MLLAIPQATPAPPTSRQDPFNLLSSMQKDSQTDSAADDFTREWNQWMRWDDQAPVTTTDSTQPSRLASAATANHNTSPVQFKEESLPQQSPLTSDNFTLDANFTQPTPSQPQEQHASFFIGSPFEAEEPLHNPFQSPSLQRPILQRASGSNDSMDTAKPPSTGSSKKRKSVTEDDQANAQELSSDSKKLPAKKRSHNVIEKRYRANLNEKIAELRDSVPSLRATQKAQGHSPDHPHHDDDEDLEGVTPANKLNKASILSKATEYIHHLETRNRKLDKENVALKARMRKLERMIEQNATTSMHGAPSWSTAESPSSSSVTASTMSPPMMETAHEASPSSSAHNPPEGLIKVPDYIRRLRPTGPQPHYADSPIFTSSPGAESSSPGSDSSSRRRSGLPTRFMVGSLAGLMCLEGLTVHRKKPESEDRGLSAIPLDMFDTLCWLGNSARQYHQYFASTPQYHQILHLSKFLFFVSAMCFAIFLYLFNSKPKGSSYALKPAKVVKAPSLASPIEVRRQAWLTSIQTVWVPRHTFFPEWFAVTARSLEYALRCLMGRRAFFWLTGSNREQETARIKAWDIAIDAQLTGGDAEVSRSRLVLTIFAAGSLPRTPARVILKALHCRILLWRVGADRSWPLTNKLGNLFASFQWRLAKYLQRSLGKDHEDALPPHLATLLEMDCDEVMIDPVIQRAYNMTLDRPTQENTKSEDALLDIVVEDLAVRSPLDALAAWWSSYALQKALLASFEFSAKGRQTFMRYLDLAHDTAPPGSAAHTRAMAIKAAFCEEDREKNIRAVLAALPASAKKWMKKSPSKKPKILSPALNLIDSSTPLSACNGIATAIRCAMIIHLIKAKSPRLALSGLDTTTTTNTDKQTVSSQIATRPPPSPQAINLFNEFLIDPIQLSLLGFVALHELLHTVAHDRNMARLPHMEHVTSALLEWVRTENPSSAGLCKGTVRKVDQHCSAMCKRMRKRREMMIAMDMAMGVTVGVKIGVDGRVVSNDGVEVEFDSDESGYASMSSGVGGGPGSVMGSDDEVGSLGLD